MGVLLRGPQERFNHQIHTEGNSLTTLMNKHFEVKRKSFDLFKRYNKFQSWMYYTGRINQGIKKGKMKAATSQEIYDNAYRIQYEGMNLLPAYSFGAAHVGAWFQSNTTNPDMTGNGFTFAAPITAAFDNVETDTKISIAVQHDPANGIFGDKMNPNDKFALGGGFGVNAIVARKGRKASTGDHIIYDCKTVGPAAAFTTDGLATGKVLTEGGSAFGEGSTTGYMRTTKNKWRINYSFVSRYSLTMTGSAKRQKVASVFNSDDRASKSWEFAEVLKGEEIFRMLNEQALRTSRTSMDVASHSWYENYGTNKLTLDGFLAESGIEAPITGNGWIPEIEDNATFDYNPNNGLDHKLLEAIGNVLANRSPAGSAGNTFLCVTDRVGRIAFDQGMKRLMQYDTSTTTSGASNIVYNVTTGEKLQLGFEVTEYNYLGNKFILMEDELLNHPGLYATNGGVTGEGHIYILNTTDIDGVPNFEVLSGGGREFKKKYVDGLHSFDPAGEQSNKAASGFDGCQVHMLSELMPVLYDVKSCGILKATTDYAGGALQGSTIAGERANKFTF